MLPLREVPGGWYVGVLVHELVDDLVLEDALWSEARPDHGTVRECPACKRALGKGHLAIITLCFNEQGKPIVNVKNQISGMNFF